MVFCTQCGAQNPDAKARFCYACGTPMVNPEIARSSPPLSETTRIPLHAIAPLHPRSAHPPSTEPAQSAVRPSPPMAISRQPIQSQQQNNNYSNNNNGKSFLLSRSAPASALSEALAQMPQPQHQHKPVPRPGNNPVLSPPLPRRQATPPSTHIAQSPPPSFSAALVPPSRNRLIMSSGDVESATPKRTIPPPPVPPPVSPRHRLGFSSGDVEAYQDSTNAQKSPPATMSPPPQRRFAHSGNDVPTRSRTPLPSVPEVPEPATQQQMPSNNSPLSPRSVRRALPPPPLSSDQSTAVVATPTQSDVAMLASGTSYRDQTKKLLAAKKREFFNDLKAGAGIDIEKDRQKKVAKEERKREEAAKEKEEQKAQQAKEKEYMARQKRHRQGVYSERDNEPVADLLESSEFGVFNCSLIAAKENKKGRDIWTTYEIKVRWGDVGWTVFRRYSQFHEFNVRISQHKTCNLSVGLPGKSVLRTTDKQARQQGLIAFLECVVREQHLFFRQSAKPGKKNKRMQILAMFFAPIQVGDIRAPGLKLPFAVEPV